MPDAASDPVSRWWNESVGAIETVVALPLLLLLLLGAATLVALLWYFFPSWVPRRWPRLRLAGRLRWPGLGWLRRLWAGLRWPGVGWLRRLWAGRWRRRKARRRKATQPQVPPATEPAEEVPDVPAAEFAGLADRLAAEGRYADAVRERLRSMVRELIERGLLEHRPGWTVTEMAAVAASRRPAVAGPLGEACVIFSEIWYGQRPAGPAHDARMRELARALTGSLAVPVGVGR